MKCVPSSKPRELSVVERMTALTCFGPEDAGVVDEGECWLGVFHLKSRRWSDSWKIRTRYNVRQARHLDRSPSGRKGSETSRAWWNQIEHRYHSFWRALPDVLVPKCLVQVGFRCSHDERNRHGVGARPVEPEQGYGNCSSRFWARTPRAFDPRNRTETLRTRQCARFSGQSVRLWNRLQSLRAHGNLCWATRMTVCRHHICVEGTTTQPTCYELWNYLAWEILYRPQ